MTKQKEKLKEILDESNRKEQENEELKTTLAELQSEVKRLSDEKEKEKKEIEKLKFKEEVSSYNRMRFAGSLFNKRGVKFILGGLAATAGLYFVPGYIAEYFSQYMAVAMFAAQGSIIYGAGETGLEIGLEALKTSTKKKELLLTQQAQLFIEDKTNEDK